MPMAQQHDQQWCSCFATKHTLSNDPLVTVRKNTWISIGPPHPAAALLALSRGLDTIQATMAKSTGESSSKCFTFCTKNMLSPIAKVYVQEPFPFDLAFVVTVHKTLRRTLKRVVVDLTHHPRCCCCMKCADIFVAMSRVAETDHIRLFEPNTIAASLHV